jgi:hypothetical protein
MMLSTALEYAQSSPARNRPPLSRDIISGCLELKGGPTATAPVPSGDRGRPSAIRADLEIVGKDRHRFYFWDPPHKAPHNAVSTIVYTIE